MNIHVGIQRQLNSLSQELNITPTATTASQTEIRKIWFVLLTQIF